MICLLLRDINVCGKLLLARGRIFAFYTAKSYYADIQFNETSGDYFALNPQIVYGEEDIRKTYNVYPFEMEGEQRNLLGKYNKVNKDSEVYNI